MDNRSGHLFHLVLSPWWKRMPVLSYRGTYLRLQFWLSSCHMQVWRMQTDTKGSEQQIALAHTCLGALCVLYCVYAAAGWWIGLQVNSEWWKALHGDIIMYQLACFQNRLLTYVCKTCVPNLVAFSQMCGGVWNISTPSNVYFPIYSEGIPSAVMGWALYLFHKVSLDTSTL